MTALKGTQRFPMTGVLDTKTDPHELPFGGLTAAQNVYRNKAGKWTPRYGRTLMTKTTNGRTIYKARRLAVRGKELCLQAHDTLYAWSADQGKWIDRGVRNLLSSVNTHVPDVVSGVQQVWYESLGYYSDPAIPSVAYGSGLLMYVWDVYSTGSSTFRYYSIVEEATGQILATKYFTGTGSDLKVCYSDDGYFMIFGVSYSGASSSLYVTRINATTLVQDASVLVANDLLGTATGTAWYDVIAKTFGNVLVAYRSTGPNVRALEWDPATNAASIAAVTVVAGDAAEKAIGWMEQTFSGGSVYLVTAASGATGVVSRTLNNATLAQTASTTHEATPGDVGNVTGWADGIGLPVAIYDKINATTYNTATYISSVAGVANILQLSCGLASRPFRVISGVTANYYVALTYESQTQSTYFVVECTSVGWTQGVAARSLRGNGGGLGVKRSHLSDVAAISNNSRFIFAARKQVELITGVPSPSPSAKKFAVVGVTLDFTAQAPAPVQFSDSLLIPSANPRAYDGLVPCEAGFHQYPEPATLALAAAGSGLTPGPYRYKLVYARLDAEGRTWRSAVSTAANITVTAGNQNVTVTPPTLRVSARGAAYAGAIIDECRIEIYRTTSNGTQYFRVWQGAFNQQTANTAVPFTDQTTDSDLIGGLPLYTDGGELDNYPPPPSLGSIVHDERILCIDAEDRRKIWASKKMVDGQGVYWNDRLSMRLDSDGDIQAIVSMDGRVIVFKKTAIYALTGSWPDATGEGNFPTAERVASGVGLADGELKSLALTPDGIFFKDSKGIYLLTRGLSAEFAGGGVVDINDGLVTTELRSLVGVSATLTERDQQMRMLMRTGEEAVFDLVLKQWSYFTYTPPNCVDSIVYNGVNYFVDASGNVEYEDSTTYRDEGLNYPFYGFRTGWIALAPHQRLYEAKFTGTLYSPSSGTFTVEYFTNHANPDSPAESQSYSFGVGAYEAIAGGKFAVAFRPKKQRTEAFMLRWYWQSVGSLGVDPVCDIESLVLEATVKKGIKGLGAAAYK